MAAFQGDIPLAPAAAAGAGASLKFSVIASTSSLKRRRNLVKAACNRCRAGKVKCDGKRPLCGRCTKLSDGEPCEYDVDDGETRQDALRKKTAGMQKNFENAVGFLEALKNMPPDELELVMASMRASSDVPSFLERYKGDTSPSRPRLQHFDSGSSNSSTGLPRSQSRKDDTRQIELAYEFPIPPRSLTEEAVNTFFVGSSKLFHVFSQEQVLEHMSQIYQENSQSPPRVCMASVFCIAAVGCAFMPPGTSGVEYEEMFFDRAKICLDDAIEACPATAAKVCCMLGMRLLFQKHRAALTFIEMGLELCRRCGLDTPTQPFDQTEAQWIDGRRTWRTLFFFASWLSSTVGYLSKNKSWAGAGAQDVVIRGETNLDDLVQTAMVTISLLKFSILRFNLDGNPLTSLSLQAMSKDLQKWYDDLPPQIQLKNVQDSSIPIPLRRTVYFCHLLYLGCLILLARRIIHTKLIAPPSPLNSISHLPDSGSEAFIHTAVVAAQQSAQIFTLLDMENGIFKRCWLCIFQAYVALTLNLYALARNLLARDYQNVDKHSECALSCLAVLEYCRDQDSVAARFYSTCAPVYFMLKGYCQQPISDANLQDQISKLLKMLCMPFEQGATDGIQVVRTWQECETTMPEYSLVVSTEQVFEASLPFHCLSANVAPGPQVRSLLDSLGSSRFLHDPMGHSWPDVLQQA